VASNGSVGAGEAYMDGLWDCDDLVSLVRILVRNRDLLDAMETGPRASVALRCACCTRCAATPASGSRRNIAAHYDLGNDFFALFLDQNLMYSSAIFASPNESLEVAQRRKLERICDKLRTGPGRPRGRNRHRLGRFRPARRAHYGCRVTTTTISREQHDACAAQRVQRPAWRTRHPAAADYRDLAGPLRQAGVDRDDRSHRPSVPRHLFRPATPAQAEHGMALIQAITIEDHRYEQALHSVDFIKRHIFPGSFIPSTSAMLGAIAQHRPQRCSTWKTSAPATRSPCATGASVSSPSAIACARRAIPSASCACGSST
jgi:cyclopropane-fatty-acyl-phospholipid synthase